MYIICTAFQKLTQHPKIPTLRTIYDSLRVNFVGHPKGELKGNPKGHP